MNFPYRVAKDWGYELWFANDEANNYCGKELGFKKGWRCSLHRHPVKDEVFYITQGRFIIEYAHREDASDLQWMNLMVGERFHVPTGMWHRMTAVGLETHSKLIEVSTFHRDEDVERLEVGGPSPRHSSLRC